MHLPKAAEEIGALLTQSGLEGKASRLMNPSKVAWKGIVIRRGLNLHQAFLMLNKLSLTTVDIG